MLLKRFVVILSPLIACAVISPVQAACGEHRLPSYDDINAVRYEHTNCYGGKCPAYEVLFTKEGKCYYSGMANVPKSGDFIGPCTPATLARAVEVLKSHAFFDLNYDSSILATDVPHYIIAVERCGVTTKLDWPTYNDRKDILSLVYQLNDITEEIRWRKLGTDERSPLDSSRSNP